ncbi:MAG TPA: DmsC/YnfH family molybdoenzyme membrane anchor subunit, partial [Thermoanaerobaculia bacterium]|nr:DmsC/YnfH family molybdoenzyme membrane anchor subunit [Thermoanaerobaculia bacterium]
MTPRGPVPAFVFAPERCTGCGACALACGIENGDGVDPGWRRIHAFNPRHHPALPSWNLSLACNHCDEPACLAACPAAAYRRDEVTGPVRLDEGRCIGCRYCSWVCPYDAPRYDAASGLMGKCTACAPRLAAGGEPACTTACPTGALAWGERPAGEPEPRCAGLAPSGLGPRLHLLLRGATETAPRGPLADPAAVQPPPPPRITARGEWALVLFTALLPALVALFAAGLARPERAPGPLALLAGGAAAFAASAFHLGRPLRAWRALARLRSSWLSREIAA